MVHIKKKEEIEKMAHGGKILAEVLFALFDKAKPGVSEIELDALAERLIIEKNGEPGFKKVKGYKHTICVSVNDAVVHGIPTNYVLSAGDVLGIDCGVFYKGFHTDMAETIKIKNLKLKIKNSEDEKDKFLSIGKKALLEAIKQAKPGNRVGHISKTVQDIVTGAGYSIVETLVGHGVGRQLHEEPEIPGFLDGPITKTPELKENMTIAVEVIYNQGKPDIVLSDDGWTIKTKDGSLSGLFERTIAITQNGPIVLTA